MIEILLWNRTGNNNNLRHYYIKCFTKYSMSGAIFSNAFCLVNVAISDVQFVWIPYNFFSIDCNIYACFSTLPILCYCSNAKYDKCKECIGKKNKYAFIVFHFEHLKNH